MKLMAAMAGIWKRLAKFIGPELKACPRHISDQQARDIGLSGPELERLRFVWPSDSSDRPKI